MLNKTNHKRLSAVIAAMATEQGYLLATQKDYKALTEAKLVEFNAAITEGDKVAFRATEAGVEAAKVEPVSAPSVSAADFQLETGHVPETSKRGGGKTAVYPFEKMDVGVSFFVANTEAKPNQAKSLASTISSANKRYAGERHFVVRAVEGGARVYSVEVPAPAAAE